ncbi:glycosyltransferase [Patescibacteria group bacterium]|nr:glycosyltransferase [Patescibacteria group bacterium]
MSGVNPFLSLIVPCYKQEKIIVANLNQLVQALDKTRYSYEIIVVMDGNVDHSFDKIKSAKLHNVVAYQYEENRGKSYAIRFGMSRANGDHIMFIDSGMEIDPDGISMLLEHMKWYSADIIVGSKRHPASLVKYTFQRKILSYGYYYFVKTLFGVKVRDTQAGIKVFKKEVLQKILPRLVEKRFAGDLEMLVVSRHVGYNRIFEAPIRLDYEFAKVSTASEWRQILGIFLDTLAIFYRKHFVKYYDFPRNKFREPAEKIKKISFK